MVHFLGQVIQQFVYCLKAFDFLRSEIQKGRQVYVVYPLIEGSEKMDYKSLEEGFEVFKEEFKEYRVCMVHGKMKAADKEKIRLELAAAYENENMSAVRVAEQGYIDNVIDPDFTRQYLIAALQAFIDKR